MSQSQADETPAPRITLVVAVARNGVIGGQNRLLWKLKSDLRRFKQITLGKPMVMGRKTFESIGRPLPGRKTIVVTRDQSFAYDGVLVAHDVAGALALAADAARDMGAQEVIIAGGGDLYAQVIGQADCLRVTDVDVAPEGDAFFPAIDKSQWREVTREAHPASADDEAAFVFVDYVRVEPQG